MRQRAQRALDGAFPHAAGTPPRYPLRCWSGDTQGKAGGIDLASAA